MNNTLPTCTKCGAPARKRTFSKYAKDLEITKCPACANKRHALWEWEHEQLLEDNIICPYCGWEDIDSWEYADGLIHEIDCPECGRTFNLDVEVEVKYTTTRREEDMPSSYPYMTDEEREKLEDEYRSTNEV